MRFPPAPIPAFRPFAVFIAGPLPAAMTAGAAAHPDLQPNRALPAFAPQRADIAAPDHAFAAPVDRRPRPGHAPVSSLPPMRQVRGPLDHRYFVDALLDKAVAHASPGTPNVVQFGDDHANLRSISMIERLLAGVVERNHVLEIGTVQFELPTGIEPVAEFNMHRVAAEVAATPGGARTYFRHVHPEQLEITKLFYLMACASRMGFRIECIDSPESITRTDSNAHRDFHMTHRIRRTLAQGAGVIAITGTNHVAPLQANLLGGSVVPGGPPACAPVNAVSLGSYAGLSHPSLRADVRRNAAWGLPHEVAEFIRFDTRAPNEYSAPAG